MLPRTSRAVRLAVLVLAVVYALYFSALTVIGHGNFHTYAYDLGTFDQGIWLAATGNDLFVTVRGLHLLGDHVRLFSFVLAPLYWIWDDVRALLILQSIVIAAGALFVFRLAARELPGRLWLALVLSAGYLLNPAVQNLNLDHAHPDAFAQTFILAAVYYLRSNRVLAFAIAAALAMSCKEDVPLVFVMLGVVLMLDRGTRRRGLAISAVAGVYFALCVFVILPHFNDVGFFRTESRGFLAGFGKHATDPQWLAGRILRPESWSYLWSLGVSHAFLFLLAPRWLLPALPALAANLLSDASYMRALTYHYHTSIVPFLIVATIDALAWMTRDPAQAGEAPAGGTGFLRRHAPALLAAVLLLSAVAANETWSRRPLSSTGEFPSAWNYLRTNSDGIAIRSALATIPDDAVVAAHYSLVPHLSHRRYIYLMPNPFKTSNWGIRGEHTHDARTVEYVALRSTVGKAPVERQMSDLKLDRSFVRIAGGERWGLYRRKTATAPGERSTCGDWNGDGTIDKNDAERIASAIMRRKDCPLRICDADGDGELQYSDVFRITRRVEDPSMRLLCPQ